MYAKSGKAELGKSEGVQVLATGWARVDVAFSTLLKEDRDEEKEFKPPTIFLV
jgi:hypothetical protein